IPQQLHAHHLADATSKSWRRARVTRLQEHQMSVADRAVAGGVVVKPGHEALRDLCQPQGLVVQWAKLDAGRECGAFSGFEKDAWRQSLFTGRDGETSGERHTRENQTSSTRTTRASETRSRARLLSVQSFATVPCRRQFVNQPSWLDRYTEHYENSVRV